MILMDVSHSSIARWLRNPDRKQYNASSRRMHGKTRLVVEGILAAVKNNPLISTRELSRLLEITSGVKISRELARCVLKCNGMTRKKARFYGEPIDLHEKTDKFLATRDAYVQEGRKFFSLDEVS